MCEMLPMFKLWGAKELKNCEFMGGAMVQNLEVRNPTFKNSWNSSFDSITQSWAILEIRCCMCVYHLNYEFGDYWKVMGTMENGKLE
jgi:hypothetical protein